MIIVRGATRDKMLWPTMNNTKWNELRLAMYELEHCPSWSTLGERLPLDARSVDDPEQRQLVHSALKKVHVPGEETPEGFRVFGYFRDGQAAVFI